MAQGEGNKFLCADQMLTLFGCCMHQKTLREARRQSL